MPAAVFFIRSALVSAIVAMLGTSFALLRGRVLVTYVRTSDGVMVLLLSIGFLKLPSSWIAGSSSRSSFCWSKIAAYSFSLSCCSKPGGTSPSSSSSSEASWSISPALNSLVFFFSSIDDDDDDEEEEEEEASSDVCVVVFSSSSIDTRRRRRRRRRRRLLMFELPRRWKKEKYQ